MKPLKNVFEGIVSFVKEHAVEIIIGTVAIVFGATITALTGGAAALFIPTLLAGLKAAAVAALTGGLISSLIALITGGNVLQAFGDGLASGYMWGGIIYAISSMASALKTVPRHKGQTAHREKVSYNQRTKTIMEDMKMAVDGWFPRTRRN